MTAAGAGVTSLGPAYGAGLVTTGLMTTALAAAYAGLQLPSGLLVDRIGVRTATLLGLGVVVVAYLVASTTPTTWLALLCRTVAGAGCAVCFVSGAELARRSGTGPSGIGVFGGFALGASGAAVVGVPLAEPFLGWRAAWVTSGAFALLALLCVLRLPALRASASATPAGRQVRPPGPSLVRDGELHRLAGVHAATLGLGIVLSNWAAVVLEQTWGFSRGAAAATGSVILGTAVVSRPLGGYLARRRPDRIGVVSAVSLVACSVATAALAVPTAAAVAVLAVVVLGVLGGLPFAAVIAAGQARRPDRPAAAIGLMNGQANSVILVATPLLGAAIDRTATTAGLLVVAALWLLPLLAPPASTRRRRAVAATDGPPAGAASDAPRTASGSDRPASRSRPR
jgi:predicted MFS family arabinose efflux permease